MPSTKHAHFLALTALLLPVSLCAQAPAAAPVIVLDAAHGGADIGAMLGSNTNEKDVTLQLAERLRTLLSARGFDVRMARDADEDPTPDQRAGQANVVHPMACLSLHATASGSGVHIYASMVRPVDSSGVTGPIPWDRAQAPFIERSLRLQQYLSDALTRSRTANSPGRTWLTPLDNMQCPALAVELAPLNSAKSTTPVTDDGYQQRVADAIAGTLLSWRNSADAVVHP